MKKDKLLLIALDATKATYKAVSAMNLKPGEAIKAYNPYAIKREGEPFIFDFGEGEPDFSSEWEARSISFIPGDFESIRDNAGEPKALGGLNILHLSLIAGASIQEESQAEGALFSVAVKAILDMLGISQSKASDAEGAIETLSRALSLLKTFSLVLDQEPTQETREMVSDYLTKNAETIGEQERKNAEALLNWSFPDTYAKALREVLGYYDARMNALYYETAMQEIAKDGEESKETEQERIYIQSEQSLARATLEALEDGDQEEAEIQRAYSFVYRLKEEASKAQAVTIRENSYLPSPLNSGAIALVKLVPSFQAIDPKSTRAENLEKIERAKQCAELARKTTLSKEEQETLETISENLLFDEEGNYYHNKNGTTTRLRKDKGGGLKVVVTAKTGREDGAQNSIIMSSKENALYLKRSNRGGGDRSARASMILQTLFALALKQGSNTLILDNETIYKIMLEGANSTNITPNIAKEAKRDFKEYMRVLEDMKIESIYRYPSPAEKAKGRKRKPIFQAPIFSAKGEYDDQRGTTILQISPAVFNALLKDTAFHKYPAKALELNSTDFVTYMIMQNSSKNAGNGISTKTFTENNPGLRSYGSLDNKERESVGRIVEEPFYSSYDNLIRSGLVSKGQQNDRDKPKSQRPKKREDYKIYPIINDEPGGED